jgi:hypothetical protein
MDTMASIIGKLRNIDGLSIKEESCKNITGKAASPRVKSAD